jgi:hypothetical protein
LWVFIPRLEIMIREKMLVYQFFYDVGKGLRGNYRAYKLLDKLVLYQGKIRRESGKGKGGNVEIRNWRGLVEFVYELFKNA